MVLQRSGRIGSISEPSAITSFCAVCGGQTNRQCCGQGPAEQSADAQTVCFSPSEWVGAVCTSLLKFLLRAVLKRIPQEDWLFWSPLRLPSGSMTTMSLQLAALQSPAPDTPRRRRAQRCAFQPPNVLFLWRLIDGYCQNGSIDFAHQPHQGLMGEASFQ